MYFSQCKMYAQFGAFFSLFNSNPVYFINKLNFSCLLMMLHLGRLKVSDEGL